MFIIIIIIIIIGAIITTVYYAIPVLLLRGTYLLIISPPIRAIWYKVFEKFKSSVIMIHVISLKSEQISWP